MAPETIRNISIVVTLAGNLGIQSECGLGWRRPLETVWSKSPDQSRVSWNSVWVYMLPCEMLFLSVHPIHISTGTYQTTPCEGERALADHSTVLMAWPPGLKGDVNSQLPLGFKYMHRLRVETVCPCAESGHAIQNALGTNVLLGISLNFAVWHPCSANCPPLSASFQS